MTIKDYMLVALVSLRANFLRSVLTTLGIVIGVASVIILVAVGTGASSEVDRQIAALGTNMLLVTSGSNRMGGRSSGAGTDIPLSESDLTAIRDKVPGVVSISGQLNGQAPVVRGNTNWTTQVSGVHADFTVVRDWELSGGRPISPTDIRSAAKVAILGSTVANELFPGEDPVGAVIRIKDVPFEVVGTLVQKGQSGIGRDQDDVVLIPITTARARIVGRSQVQNDQIGNIYVKFDPEVSLADAQEEIESVMRQRRVGRPGTEDRFSVRNIAEFMKARTEVLSTMSLLLAATSVISLVVGGIGIMNIMLVSVTERTREIGLRMAVGARRRDILRQFLVEAITLCMLGGLIGVATGLSISALVSYSANWPILISPGVLALALGAAAATGLVFGYVPARRAAFLNPIEALRSE